MEENILSKKKVIKQLTLLVNELLECEKKEKECKNCKLFKKGCLKFIRDAAAVALQFIIVSLQLSPETESSEEDTIYS